MLPELSVTFEWNEPKFVLELTFYWLRSYRL
jgi:hypothetical protein